MKKKLFNNNNRIKTRNCKYYEKYWGLSFLKTLGKWRCSSIFLDLGTRYSWVPSFTYWRLYPGKRALGIHWTGDWTPESGWTMCSGENSFLWRESNLGCSPSLSRLSYPGSSIFKIHLYYHFPLPISR
jgi:hypothetical protein